MLMWADLIAACVSNAIARCTRLECVPRCALYRVRILVITYFVTYLPYSTYCSRRPRVINIYIEYDIYQYADETHIVTL